MKKILIAAFGLAIAATPAFALECKDGQGTMTGLDFKVDQEGRPLTNQPFRPVIEYCVNGGSQGYYVDGKTMPGYYASPLDAHMAYDNAKAFRMMLERLRLSDEDGAKLLEFVKKKENEAKAVAPTLGK